MNRRQIGRTRLRVTPLGFGGAPLGNSLAAVSEKEGAEAVDAAWDSGCRYFDTAPFYGYGLSERRIGDGLRHRRSGDIVLSTKVGRLIRPGDDKHKPGNFPGSLPFHPIFDYSYDGIMRSVEDSHQRLGLSRIDILLIHDIDKWTHGDEAAKHARVALRSGYRALDRLRGSGAVSAIGIGVNEIAACEAAMKAGDFDCFLLAGRYSLLEQTPVESFFPACLARSISIIIGGPFNSGVLARAGKPDATYDYGAVPKAIQDRVQKISRVCASHRVQLPDAALQFCLAHPVVASVIPGARNAAEAKSHWRMIATKIPDGFWRDLKVEGLMHPDAPVPGGPGARKLR